MGGIAIDKQIKRKYFSDVEEDVFVFKNGGGPRVYVEFHWHNKDYHRYTQFYWGKNIYFPFRYKKRYKLILLNDLR